MSNSSEVEGFIRRMRELGATKIAVGNIQLEFEAVQIIQAPVETDDEPPEIKRGRDGRTRDEQIELYGRPLDDFAG